MKRSDDLCAYSYVYCPLGDVGCERSWWGQGGRKRSRNGGVVTEGVLKKVY